jgi:hypothetical protein
VAARTLFQKMDKYFGKKLLNVSGGYGIYKLQRNPHCEQFEGLNITI